MRIDDGDNAHESEIYRNGMQSGIVDCHGVDPCVDSNSTERVLMIDKEELKLIWSICSEAVVVAGDVLHDMTGMELFLLLSHEWCEVRCMSLLSALSTHGFVGYETHVQAMLHGLASSIKTVTLQVLRKLLGSTNSDARYWERDVRNACDSYKQHAVEIDSACTAAKGLAKQNNEDILQHVEVKTLSKSFFIVPITIFCQPQISIGTSEQEKKPVTET